MATWDQIRAGIFAGESGGDYDALFGYSNRDGGRFANTRLTDMTVGDAINFSAPSGDYGQWVKGRIGRVATPMGAYQVVGTTLRDAARGLGLAGDERMTPELQDKIGRWVYDQQGTGAWEGYRGPQDPQAPSYRVSTKGATDMPTYTTPERDQAPRGLLGMLGIEKRDESAGGQTAQPFYQRDRFKDTMGNLAMAFNEMRLNPSDAIPAIVSRQQDKRQDAAQSSRTAAWLRSQGREDLASAVETGTLGGKDAVALAFKPAETTKGVAIGDFLVNPTTGEVMADLSGGYDAEAVSAARKEFTSQGFVKDFSDQTAAYGRIISSVENPSPTGDLALIFNFMKVLDPGSTVREGEFATAEQAGRVDDRVRNMYNRVLSGERLTAEQRADFASRATRLYAGADKQYRVMADQYAGFATAAGLPADQVIPDFSFSGDLYSAPLEFRRPPRPAGTSEEDWAAAWENMPDEARRTFIEGQ